MLTRLRASPPTHLCCNPHPRCPSTAQHHTQHAPSFLSLLPSTPPPLSSQGDWTWVNAYTYLAIVINFSQLWALYCLAGFYLQLRGELSEAGLRPLGKFVTVKAIVFFSWWQGIIISLLFSFGLIHEAFGWSSADLRGGLQDFIICIEIAGFALCHHRFFSYQDFNSELNLGMARKHSAARAMADMVPTDVLADARVIVKALVVGDAYEQEHRELMTAQAAPMQQHQPVTPRGTGSRRHTGTGGALEAVLMGFTASGSSNRGPRGASDVSLENLATAYDEVEYGHGGRQRASSNAVEALTLHDNGGGVHHPHHGRKLSGLPQQHALKPSRRPKSPGHGTGATMLSVEADRWHGVACAGAIGSIGRASGAGSGLPSGKPPISAIFSGPGRPASGSTAGAAPPTSPPAAAADRSSLTEAEGPGSGGSPPGGAGAGARSEVSSPSSGIAMGRQPRSPPPVRGSKSPPPHGHVHVHGNGPGGGTGGSGASS